MRLPRGCVYKENKIGPNTDPWGTPYFMRDIDIEEVGKVLEKYNLQVNVDKTEFTNLSRGETNWQTTKKVGTLIGDQEDIERRKQLSSAALVKLKNVW
ncbi:hypothetical protein ElyMa_001094000 [Elysia marginata]|uniref:Uncharacterized protein n=1 Tax=Elysia marginata TaxID=1093978 RepID=A0AAV4HU68_9GAST|nr:hypothetical protein ElyMa_001094000 [Elysia marginata]